MLDFIIGSDVAPDSGPATAFGIDFAVGFGLGFFRKAAVTAPLRPYGHASHMKKAQPNGQASPHADANDRSGYFVNPAALA
jgi:hypothetical protein